jgi:hypothetical protein
MVFDVQRGQTGCFLALFHGTHRETASGEFKKSIYLPFCSITLAMHFGCA